MICGRSKTGLPTLAECGGGMSSTGSARVICGPHGEALKPLFVPRGYSNGDHALFVVRPGMLVVCAGYDRRGERASVDRIVAIGSGSSFPDEVLLEPLFSVENGDGDIPEYLWPAVQAALDKAHSYHCRRAFFFEEVASDKARIY